MQQNCGRLFFFTVHTTAG